MLARVRRKVSSQYGGYRDIADSHHHAQIGEMLTADRGGAKASSRDAGALLSYIGTAEAVFGPAGGRVVLTCTLFASLGVCSAYVVFITESACSLLEGECR